MNQYEDTDEVETDEYVQSVTLPLRRSSHGQIELIAQLASRLSGEEASLLIRALKRRVDAQ